MYWQVYMHKTVISSESLLVNILKRAKELAGQGIDLYSTPSLRFFLYNTISKADLISNIHFTPGIIAANFTRLDDSDILISAKYWADNSDKVLSDLSRRLLRRDLFAIELQDSPFPEKRVNELKSRAVDFMMVGNDFEDYYVFTDSISNMAYTPDATEVKILLKNGSSADISTVSDMFNHRFLSERVTKYFLCYPKECR